MILELMLLVFARIIYLTLAGVSFRTLFLLPLPNHVDADEYINAKLLGLYKKKQNRKLFVVYKQWANGKNLGFIRLISATL